MQQSQRLQHPALVCMHEQALHQIALALNNNALPADTGVTCLQARTTFPYYGQQAAVCVCLSNDALLPCCPVCGE